MPEYVQEYNEHETSYFVSSHITVKNVIPFLLRHFIVWLGPVFIKLAQVLSTRMDVLPDTYLNEFAKLRNSVPAESRKNIERIIASIFPGEIFSKTFSFFDWTPVAAGAVAQVHRATLMDGTRVAVKILRPGIEKSLQRNFRWLLRIVAMFEWLPLGLKRVDLRGVCEELKELLLTQVDLGIEARNFVEFSEVFKNDVDIKIPRVFLSISGPSCVVTEFVDAVCPENFKKLGVDSLSLANRFDHLMDTMVFVRGLCHADLHPGNFFWTEDGRITLIDLGLIHHVTPEDRLHAMTFHFAVMEGFLEFAIRYFIRHFMESEICQTIVTRAEEDEIVEDFSVVLDKEFFVSDGKPRFSKILRLLLGILAKYQMKLKPRISKLLLTVVSWEGYLLCLDPRFNIVENARRKKLDFAEYTSVPSQAEQLVVGVGGTYSVPIFEDASTLQDAYDKRDDLVLSSLHLGVGSRFIDVGCGRGRLLSEAKRRGIDAYGITISREEFSECSAKGLHVLLSSWEDYGSVKTNQSFEGMAVIEMFLHMASFHENREGLLDLRLKRFYEWTPKVLARDARVFVQSITADERLFTDQRYALQLSRVIDKLPWIGFPTLNQMVSNAAPYLKVLKIWKCPIDLKKTFELWRNNINENRKQLRELVGEDVLEYIDSQFRETENLRELGLLSLDRVLFKKTRSCSCETINN